LDAPLRDQAVTHDGPPAGRPAEGGLGARRLTDDLDDAAAADAAHLLEVVPVVGVRGEEAAPRLAARRLPATDPPTASTNP